MLVIAATDSSGGAGLTRDIETLSAFQTAARCAVTAVTVQTDRQFHAAHQLPGHLVRAQIRAALDGGGIGAIKIGMLGTADTVRAVAESLPPREQIPIVLDPVLASSSGGRLLDPAGEQLLREQLLPRVTLLTPNIPEAAMLLGQPRAQGREARLAQLPQLLSLGPRAVLLKGGHDEGEEGNSVIDWLALGGREVIAIRSPRVRAQRRGTGCSAASAIAAQLAAGKSLEQACRGAQAYIIECLQQCAPLKS